MTRPGAVDSGGVRVCTADVESNEVRVVVVEAFGGANVVDPGEAVPMEGVEPIMEERSVVTSCIQAPHQNCGGGGWNCTHLATDRGHCPAC